MHTKALPAKVDNYLSEDPNNTFNNLPNGLVVLAGLAPSNFGPYFREKVSQF